MSTKPGPQSALRQRVTLGEMVAIGPGKIKQLEATAETGSLLHRA